jgi:AraC-like DNA-binding protein
VGIVKVVVGDETPPRDFAPAARLLSLVVSGLCQESVASALSEEVGALRDSLAALRRTRSKAAACMAGGGAVETPTSSGRSDSLGLVERAILHLQRHHQTTGLSLASVARALGCNSRYLTTRFSRVVGDRMHAYLVKLRVAHACHLLLQTSAPIKEIGYSSGFRCSASLARAFRRHVGVPPGAYRRIFRDGD